MPSGRIDDLRAFREFIDGQLGNGGADITPEECLDLWILENRSDSEREGRRAKNQQGPDGLYAGRTRPAREALNELRRKHSLPEEL
jgi:hypothetical protein